MSIVADRFDRWSFSWKQCLNLVVLPDGMGQGKDFRHSSKKLLQAIRLSMKLRGGPSSLVEIIAKSLAAVLPAFCSKRFSLIC
jgi:hypothetical protein